MPCSPSILTLLPPAFPALCVSRVSGPSKPADGSPPAVCVEHILSALDHMSDDEKRRVLLKLKPDTQPGPQGTQEEPQEEGRRLGGVRTVELEREVGGRPGEGQAKAGSREAEAEMEVVLRLHNTWGGTKAIGIEQVL